MSPRVIILIGPPGSGKGTQAPRLAGKLQIPVIATGNILRHECESGTPLGKAVNALLLSGELVPDTLVNEVVARRISLADAQNGFLLDGYPRSVPQASFFDRHLEEIGMPKPAVLHIDVPRAMLMRRIAGRLQCPACGRSYPGAGSGHEVCADDRATLVRRADDSETVI